MSGNVTQLNFFAALPGRVTTDDRLAGLQFRILATIAGHDRMGRNGQCCWAGRKTLASRVNCAEGSFSRAVSDLIEWGYLKVVRNEADARRVGYAVIYDTEADAAGIGSKGKQNRSQDGDLSSENRSPIRHLSRGDRSQDGHLSSIQEGQKSQLNELVRRSLPNPNILCETQDITRSKNTPPKSRATSDRNPRMEIVREWFGEDCLHDGWEALKLLSDDRWKELIGLWRAGRLTDRHRDEACDYAERLLQLKALA